MNIFDSEQWHVCIVTMTVFKTMSTETEVLVFYYVILSKVITNGISA